MRLKVYGSGSAGNLYSLKAQSGETLVIEAGVPPQVLLRDTRHENIAGVLVSHRHGDHAGHLRQFLRMRLPVRVGEDVLHTLPDERGFPPLLFEEYSPFRVGGFQVIAFPLKHDVPCHGFLIRHGDMTGNLLFCTDTAAIPYAFEDARTLMIEADYDTAILRHNEDTGRIHPKLAGRIRESHYSIGQALRFCKGRDLANVRNIILLHLSRDNADGQLFRRLMTEATGCPVHIAEPGLEVEVGNNPF